MALALGKRKRRQDVSKTADAEASDDDAAARALFQRAFEKKFKPLEKSERPAKEDVPTSDDDEDDDEDSDDVSGSELDDDEDESEDWSGFSGDEDPEPSNPEIEVIEDKTFRRRDPAEEKRLKKQFMTSRIPSDAPKYPIPHKPSATASPAATDGEAQEDNDNLQNDLALQRLLKESHLLDANTFSANGTASSAPEGAARLKALDMRIRDLGGKKSHLDQERMPIAFRKGMVAKAGEREDKRRTEAKENGIILERFGSKNGAGGSSGAASRGGGGKDRKRPLGVGGPDIGTYRGATLRLSKNDIKGMESSGKRGGKGGRGGRGGKRKGPTKFGSGF